MARAGRGIVLVEALLAVVVLGAGLGGLLRLLAATWRLQGDTWTRFEARLAGMGALAGRPPQGPGRFRVEVLAPPPWREVQVSWDRKDGEGRLRLPGRGPRA
ncbi:MAG TPA: hypothetical protein VK188_12380 [Holophaga sp.]|nr:hypothetical protein [Holophaga sp.]